MKATADDIMGVGVIAFSDKAGTNQLSTTGASVSLAYHRDMEGDGKNLLSMGIQGGMVQMGFDPNEMRFAKDILSENPSSTGNIGSATYETSIVYADINAGVMWNSLPNDKFNFYFGLSAYHLTKPSQNFFQASDKNILSSRLSVQWGAAIFIADKFDILPSVLYMRQDASNETNLGGAFRFNVPFMKVRFGSWYRLWRNSDAMIFMTGVEWENLTVGLSYDINVSSLKETSNGQGSFELALIYIIKIKKDIVRDVSCPSF